MPERNELQPAASSDSRAVVRQGAVMAVALTVANMLGYGLSLFASRRLGPAEFGVFAAMLGLIIVGFVVSLGVQTVVTRTLAGQPDADLGGPRRNSCGRIGLHRPRRADRAWPIAAFLHLASPQPGALDSREPGPAHLVWFRPGCGPGSRAVHVLAVVVLSVSGGKVLGGLVGVALSRSATVALALTAVGTLARDGARDRSGTPLLARPDAEDWAGRRGPRGQARTPCSPCSS